LEGCKRGPGSRSDRPLYEKRGRGPAGGEVGRKQQNMTRKRSGREEKSFGGGKKKAFPKGTRGGSGKREKN